MDWNEWCKEHHVKLKGGDTDGDVFLTSNIQNKVNKYITDYGRDVGLIANKMTKEYDMLTSTKNTTADMKYIKGGARHEQV